MESFKMRYLLTIAILVASLSSQASCRLKIKPKNLKFIKSSTLFDDFEQALYDKGFIVTEFGGGETYMHIKDEVYSSRFPDLFEGWRTEISIWLGDGRIRTTADVSSKMPKVNRLRRKMKRANARVRYTFESQSDAQNDTSFEDAHNAKRAYIDALKDARVKKYIKIIEKLKSCSELYDGRYY